MESFDSWEDRMAARAATRRAERERREREQDALERADWERQLQEQDQARFEAGPPGGCRECYAWVQDWFAPRSLWRHVDIDEGDRTCYHSCHAEPVPCAPVVIG